MAIHKIPEPPKITPPRQTPPQPPSAAAKKPSKPPPTPSKKPEKKTDKPEKTLVWDCGSSLYDSFELKSFEKQLDSAINSRSLSMPHLSDRRLDSKPVPPPPQTAAKKQQSKISRSIQRILRSVFKVRNTPDIKDSASRNGFYVLTTIPEVPELDSSISPEMNAFVRRTASDRFMFTPVGISCIQ